MTPDASKIQQFRQTVQAYYQAHGRHNLPWRLPAPDGTFDPYRILVSEMMLQQTQVPRVIPKFTSFVERFTGFDTLARASLGDVLAEWVGLGYNRRAKFLHQTAQQVVRLPGGRLPQTKEALVGLPGIGPNTAGAILAYAYDQPEIFIETNLRTVFIHHFFGQFKVADEQIEELVSLTLPQDAYRQWYWALMDYGTFLKASVGNAARRSAHYTKQSAFAGSRRQIRGAVIRKLARGPVKQAQFVQEIKDDRLPGILQDLEQEGFIIRLDADFFGLKS